MLDYVRSNPEIRDVLVSGGDIANVPIARLEEFVSALLDMPHVRDIRLASKSRGAPQHFLQPACWRGSADWRGRRDPPRQPRPAYAREPRVPDHAAGRRAANALLDLGFRDVRNQAVLLRGVNATRDDQLDLCWRCSTALRSRPTTSTSATWSPTPSTGGRRSGRRRRSRPGSWATFPAMPRRASSATCRSWGRCGFTRSREYDRELGVSRWRANDWAARRLRRRIAEYYDPIHTLPETGQAGRERL